MVIVDRPVPASSPAREAAGQAARTAAPRRTLAELVTTGRDPLGILAAQNSTRVPELVPLRRERMAASAFAFYRGTAALMAADLAASPTSGIQVASCGDAHVANFGFYASPQRTLVFDLNDFDEAAWAPWECDLKRLVTSIVIAGQATDRAEDVTTDAARAAVRSYVTALRGGRDATPLARYYQHFDAVGGLGAGSRSTRRVVKAAIADAEKRTGERASRKLTTLGDDGRLRFVERPPTMTHVDAELEELVTSSVTDYLSTTRADVRLLLAHYAASDTVRRVVGVGSVGTRCYATALVDGDGATLLLQTKEAGRSVLAEHGARVQPPDVAAYIDEHGEGGRVVAMQRILQGVSDPLLGSFRGTERDYYVRQFRDMKGGIDVETVDDASFRLYAQACAAVLARAHGQSPTAAEVVGYIGDGRLVTRAIVEWARAYAELSRQDYDLFVAAG
ncbi:MAG: DUF2252 domain-containing protein [Microbacterium sp.]|uniref:DUF2252 domain-containing protein n=1 Tax=Microbacterium sp. TaxID=51671 RepID=UPI001ACFD88D|nr:DUF2252 domain-containing protein [Microbacterium sp.]MBN9177518.1 DUF2252 domain-containing protein [Microbacterium sp.]